MFFILTLAVVATAFKTPVGVFKRDTPTTVCDNTIVPVQVRLAYASPNGMAVSWNTNSKLAVPTVFYGTNPSHLNSIATSSISVTYATSTTYNNHVKIYGLQPNTKYYYIPACGSLSSPYSFTTARKIGDTTPFSFAMIGDMGTFGPDGLSTHVGTGAANPLAPGDLTTIQSLQNAFGTFDFIYHGKHRHNPMLLILTLLIKTVGDIAYADAWLKEETGGYLPEDSGFTAGSATYDRILNDFFDEVEPLSSLKPYMVLPGNHEANCDNGSAKNGTTTYTATSCLAGQSNFTGYRMHWDMPFAESGGV
jgi:acid phosphatase type 7